MIRLQREPIDHAALVSDVRADADGAVAVFLGTVRQTNGGQSVLFLEYEAYAGMAERELERIERDALSGFEISRLAIAHRIGRVEVGDVSVAIAVAAPHRAAAMDACRFAIDALKARVPIWKREHYEGGVVWIEGQGTRRSV